MNDAPVRYLSLEWIDALSAEVAGSEALAELAGVHRIGITQVVTGGPEGEITYHLQVGDGVARFGAGAADPEDVRMVESWDSAVAVAQGTMNAQEAFIKGHIRLSGNQQKLIESQEVFVELSRTFTEVGKRTDYR